LRRTPQDEERNRNYQHSRVGHEPRPNAWVFCSKVGDDTSAQPDSHESTNTIGEGKPRAELARGHVMTSDKESRNPPHGIDDNIGQSLSDRKMTQTATKPQC